MNRSFRKKMIFRLGYDAGFFSEFNNMILAAVYCAVHGIQFRINSSYANFKFKKGWEDFFLPFFKEERGVYNKKYNYRPYLRKPEPIREGFFKLLSGTKYFTQDLWPLFRDNKFLNGDIYIPQLQFTGSMHSACHEFLNMVWRFNPIIEQEVEDFIREMNLPDQYIGMHIRRGDKFNETKLNYEVEAYLNIAEKNTPNRNLFLATDDYSVISIIKRRNNWKLYHRVSNSDNGYYQHDFDRKNSGDKFRELSFFLGNIQVLCQSTIFVGAINTNVSMFVGMKRGKKNNLFIDSSEWKVW